MCVHTSASLNSLRVSIRCDDAPQDKVSAAIGFHNPWVQTLFRNVDSYSDDTKKVAAYTKQVLDRLPR